MTTTQTILGLAEELRIIADEISYNAFDSSSDYPKRGTIVKALPSQARFKPKYRYGIETIRVYRIDASFYYYLVLLGIIVTTGQTW
jgi:hypothetical protein